MMFWRMVIIVWTFFYLWWDRNLLAYCRFCLLEFFIYDIEVIGSTVWIPEHKRTATNHRLVVFLTHIYVIGVQGQRSFDTYMYVTKAFKRLKRKHYGSVMIKALFSNAWGRIERFCLKSIFNVILFRSELRINKINSIKYYNIVLKHIPGNNIL